MRDAGDEEGDDADIDYVECWNIDTASLWLGILRQYSGFSRRYPAREGVPFPGVGWNWQLGRFILSQLVIAIIKHETFFFGATNCWRSYY